MRATSTVMSEDSISYSKNSNEIRKQVKNTKYYVAYSVLKK